MQGVLTDSAFSDEFWLETLPLLYAKSKKTDLERAKKILRRKFDEYGKYDYRYYSVNHWIKELNLKIGFDDIKKLIKNKPLFYKDIQKLLQNILGKFRIILISTTTYDFIESEIGENKKYFNKIYSTLDDFNIAGKTKDVYEKIARENKVLPLEILHVGDNKEMDVKNAKKAGFKTLFFDDTKPREENIKNLKTILKI